MENSRRVTIIHRMILHSDITNNELYRLIRLHEVYLAGNRQLKIFGSLKCGSGKRMKKSNRVFFSSQDEALKLGFRPCGNCMKKAYKEWIEKF